MSKQHDYKHTLQETHILPKACSYVVKHPLNLKPFAFTNQRLYILHHDFCCFIN